MKKIILVMIVVWLMVLPVVNALDGSDIVSWVFKPSITGFATRRSCFDNVQDWGCENIVMNKDGRIRVELIEASASLISDVYMDDPEEQLLIPNNLKSIGAVTEDEYPAGTSFSFFIRIHGSGGDYDHHSDSKFCKLEVLGENEYKLRFEDLPEGRSDCDYNDVVLLVEVFENENECILNEICDGLDNDCDGAVDEGLVEDCGSGVGECSMGQRTCVNGEWGECDGSEPDIEVCDGLDNDCDGAVDEGLVEDCGSDVGQCVAGQRTCVNGDWDECGGSYVGPSQEVCDGVDNDCDGDVDNGIGCECSNNQQRACGSDVGECSSGTQTCFFGEWGDCEGGLGPQDEECDGLDNDCDGAIDEEVTKICGEHFIGECERGEQICENGEWSVCLGVVNPVVEVCDKKDNDCDGLIDESLTDICGVSDIGECSFGEKLCSNGVWGSCVGAVNPGDEICDGLDNDCDGAIDEGLNCNCLDGEESYCGSDVGECRMGMQSCTNGQWGECVGSLVPSVEVCDNKDNDCDGSSDENLNCECLDGEERACGVNIGECIAGVQTCANGVWGECVGSVDPAMEICNGLDDDCDGSVDEDIGRVCGSDVGECVAGIESCIGGGWGECAGSLSPQDEVCDGVDNDCDGLVDNGIDCSCMSGEERECGSDVGECRSGRQTCFEGEWGACEGNVKPNVEVCDGEDNDCDGKTDESITRRCGTSDVGSCEYGIEVCADGEWTGECFGAIWPVREECLDGLDNDCDGFIDEDCLGSYPLYEMVGGSLGGSGANIPMLDIEFVEVPDVVDVVDSSFKTRAIVTNTGSVEVKNVRSRLESSGSWTTDEVFELGDMKADESKGIIFTLEADLCSKKRKDEDMSYTEREFDIEVLAKGDNAVDADAQNIKVHVPQIAITSAKTDYSIDNMMKACFFINNFDKDKKERVELEFELSDFKEDILIDFIDHVKVNANETLIKSKSYRIEKIPRPKEYNLRVGMFENGSVFTKGYVSGRAFNKVDLSEFQKVQPRFGQLLLRLLNFLKG